MKNPTLRAAGVTVISAAFISMAGITSANDEVTQLAANPNNWAMPSKAKTTC